MQSAILLLISLAFASAFNIQPNPFQPKQVGTDDALVFDYESDILHGIEGASQTYSGLKIKGQLVCTYELARRPLSGSTTLKLRNVEILQAKRLELPTPLNQIPVGDMARLSDVEDLVEMIQKPFGFKFLESEIDDGKIYVERDDEDWSVNIKRAIVSGLQPFLPKEFEKTPQVFNVQERDISGTCDTKITYNKLSGSDEVYVLNKVRNFTNCEETASPIYKFSTSGLSRCLERTEDELTCKYELVPSMKTQYEILVLEGSETIPAVLLQARQNSMYFIPITGVKTNTVAVHGLTSMVLKKVIRDNGEVRPITGGRYVSKNIEFEVNKKQLLPERILETIEMSEQGRFEEEIVREIETLHGQIKLGAEEVKVQLEKVVGLLRKCTPTMLKRIMKQIRDEEQQTILMDLLPTCGTPECATVVLELIEEESVSLVKSITYVKSLSLKAQPCKKIIEQLLKLSERLQKVSLKRTVVLAVGTMTDRLQTMYKDARRYEQVESFVNRIVSKLIDIAENNIRTNMDRCKCVLKALGNIQLTREQVSKTLDLAKSQKYETEIRIEAIDTVRKVESFEYLEKVLLEIFLDQSENVELRMHCVKLLVEKECSLPTLQIIVQHIQYERNVNLQSFVCSMLKSYSEMVYPTTVAALFRENLKHLLITNKLPVFPIQYSHTLKMFGLDIPSLSGAYSVLQYTTPVSTQMVPAWINYKTYLTGMGHVTKPIEVSLKTKGLPQYLQQVLGSKVSIIAKMLEGELSLEKIKEIFQEESMKLPRELYELFNNNEYRTLYMSRDFDIEKNLELSIRLFNYETIYLDVPALREIVEDVLKTLIVKSSSPRDIYSQVTDLLEQLQTGLDISMTNILGSVNAMTLIPSPTGLNTAWNSTYANIFHMRGQLKIVTEPRIEKCIKYLQFPRKIHIETQNKDFQIRHILIKRNKLVSAIPKIQTGVMYEAFVSTILPINGELELVREHPRMTLRTIYKLAQRQKPSVTAYMRPATIVVLEEKKEIKVYEQVTPILAKETVEPFTIQKTIQLPYLFPEITMEVESCIRKTPFSAVPLMACPNKLRLVVEQELDTPVELLVELRPYERIERPIIKETMDVESAYQKLWSGLYGEDIVDMVNDTDSRIPFDFGHVEKHFYRSALKVKIQQRSSSRWLSTVRPEVELNLKWIFTRNFLHHQFAVLMTQKSLPQTYVKGHFVAPTLCMNGFCNQRQFAGLSVFVDHRRISMINLFVEDLKEINKYLGIHHEQCFNQQTQLLKYVLPQTVRVEMRSSPMTVQLLPKSAIETLVILQGWIHQIMEQYADVSMRYNPRIGVLNYELLVKMCPALGKVDLVANTMLTTIRATNLPVFTFLVPDVLPIRPTTVNRQSLYKPVCTKTAKIVKTFEGKVYHTSEKSECETVLAKDCRPRPQWMITSTTEETSQQKIEIYYGQESLIQIVPRSFGVLPKLIVNGKHFNLERELTSLRIPSEYTTDHIVCQRQGFEGQTQKVICQSEIQGWTVVSDGYETKVVIAPEMRGYVCGQCEYLQDSSRSEELINHVIESGSCRRERTLSLRTCQPVLQHRIVKRHLRKGDMICISQQAFPECPRTCRPENKYRTLKNVNFVCMEKEEAISRGYIPAQYNEYTEKIESIDRVYDLPFTGNEITEELLDIHERC
ncbi:DgyrCDS7247 [Dimorphilus gyrociliatus]|uniref:DgyrCDS7247 n=1 Tax=Dimorphilus gyrociliatus TaxID=2664684 RepID=A0A7I8VSR7_9ANNE|nr:DgyrCDS7247 [Dimorphilus gyrociliatus]